MTKLEALKNDIGTRDELIERWKDKAREMKERADHLPHDSLTRQLIVMHVQGIEHCISDIELWEQLAKMTDRKKAA